MAIFNSYVTDYQRDPEGIWIANHLSHKMTLLIETHCSILSHYNSKISIRWLGRCLFIFIDIFIIPLNLFSYIFSMYIVYMYT